MLTTTTPGSSLQLPGNNNLVVVAGNSGASVNLGAASITGVTALTVQSGSITLPAGSFDSRILDGRLYAGEIVRLDALGSTVNARLGSSAGSGAAGDPLPTDVPDNLTLDLSVPDLRLPLPRLNGATLLSGFASVVTQQTGITIDSTQQGDSGVLQLPFNGGKIIALPVGEIVIDTGRASGLFASTEGMQLVSGGLVTTVAPSVGDFTDFADRLGNFAVASTASIARDGTIQAEVRGKTYVVQPGWLALPGNGAPGFQSRADGYIEYVAGDGSRQVLYPAFADLAQVTATLGTQFPEIRIVAKGNGAFVATRGNVVSTLVPDYVLIPVPVEHANDTLWQDASGKFYIRYDTNRAQGFSMK